MQFERNQFLSYSIQPPHTQYPTQTFDGPKACSLTILAARTFAKSRSWTGTAWSRVTHLLTHMIATWQGFTTHLKGTKHNI